MRRAPNLLLVKDDIGKARPSTRDLPNPDFTYGLPGPTDEEGVGKCKCFKLSGYWYVMYSDNDVESASAIKERTTW